MIRIYPSYNGIWIADDVLDGVGCDGPYLDPAVAAEAARRLEQSMKGWTPAYREGLNANVAQRGFEERDPQEVGN